MERNEIAADIHRRMCEDERFGYSWEERYGTFPETWDVRGHKFEINVGDYDCSSSTITAWKKALEGTPYEHALDGATYTGNMRAVFCGSGLFDWVPVSQARRGDPYLNEANHVAMCQGGGLLSEFSGNEYGGAYGGQRGDQTGWESHVCGFYSYPWDGCLRYNGKADGDDKPKRRKDDKMQCIIRPNGENYLVYVDGSDIHPLQHPDEAEAIRMAYRQCNDGQEIPSFAMGGRTDPWATRLFDALRRKM